LPIDFDDRRVGAGGKCELGPDETIGAGDNVRFGMREGVVEGRLQAGFHVIRDQMLVVVRDPAKLREGDSLRGRARHLHDTVFDAQLSRLCVQNVSCEL
jgi:hypothetical protein